MPPIVAMASHGYLLHHAQSVARRLIGDLVADHLDQPAAGRCHGGNHGFFAVVKPGLHHSTINFNTPWRNPLGARRFMYTYFKGRLGGIGEVLNIGGMGLKPQAKKETQKWVVFYGLSMIHVILENIGIYCNMI